jgi:hypothetical protein
VSERPGPDVLEVYVGSFSSPSYGLWWDGRQLVYESFISGYEDRRQTFIAPSDAQWSRFWRTMEAIDVWSWRERYEPGARFEPAAQIRDGTHWSLSLQRGGRRVESAGDSSGPGATDLDESAQFAAFAEAVSRLTGGYAFGADINEGSFRS